MPKHPMVPPGFEHLFPLGPISAALTKPNPQPGLKIELPSHEPSTAPESHSDPKLSAIAAKVRVGMPGTSRKRAANGKASEVKRRKKDPKFNRLFSEEDEMALLNGMIRFADMNKCDPLEDLEAFLMFMGPDLNAVPTTVQLKSKILKLKQKYVRNLRKEAGGGLRKQKAHERRAYNLSKLVWANQYIVAGRKRAKADKNVVVAASGGGPSEAEMEILSLDDVSINRTKILRIGAQLFETGKGVEGESEWRALRKAESGVHLKMTELIRTKMTLDLDVLNARNC